MWVIVLYETISTAIRFLDCRTFKSNKSISNLRPWGHDGFFSEERESEKEASKSQRAGYQAKRCITVSLSRVIGYAGLYYHHAIHLCEHTGRLYKINMIGYKATIVLLLQIIIQMNIDHQVERIQWYPCTLRSAKGQIWSLRYGY